MLIQALCDYYDILGKAGKVLPQGYSRVEISFLIALTAGGQIAEILDVRQKEEIEDKNGKSKEYLKPKKETMPWRTQKNATDSNVIEHRSKYIFGLEMDKNELVISRNAKKSHEAFAEKNLEFIEDLHSPLIDAYRNFIITWDPNAETENNKIIDLKKNYNTSGYAFCLDGYPEHLLHEEKQIKDKWEKTFSEGSDSDGFVAQCAIEGKMAPIAPTHNKIKGVKDGQPSGTVLVGYDKDAYQSYGMKQSYNSNISQEAMGKYTESLNYLLESQRHTICLNGVTIVFWAMAEDENCEDMLRAMLYGESEKMDAGQAEGFLCELLKDAKTGKITEERLRQNGVVKADIDFYLLGIKPNAARLSIKFFHRKTFAQMLFRIAEFQQDIQMTQQTKLISLNQIRNALCNPNVKDDEINQALFAKLFDAMTNGTDFPTSLLATVVRRIKTDRLNDKDFNNRELNRVRTGIIKACINRKCRKAGKKEEFNVALDKENTGQAYLCGRLFAVLERIQEDASGGNLNRTIKDSYFACAASRPAIIFPKLIKLAQNHLKKVSEKNFIFYDKLIGEITDGLAGEFPDTLSLTDQGRFMIGYYQQRASFFEKHNKENEPATEEKNDSIKEE